MIKKKIWKILPVSALAVFMFVGVVYSQTLTYERAYGDYTFTLQQYRDAHTTYLQKRIEFLQFETLTSRDAAHNATIAMLRARDDVIRVYLTVIRTRMVEAEAIADDEKQTFYSLLDPEVAWYQSHRINYNEADSLELLITKSDTAAKRYEGTTNFLVHDALFALSVADVTNQRELHGVLLTRVTKKISEIKSVGDKETVLLERWMGDIASRLVDSKASENKAIEQYDKIRERKRKIEEGFSDGVKILVISLQRISEANGFLSEIILEIKTGD